ncbi:MAG TPA: hypothetical protein VK453_00510 [Micromonosporaceae bacterium]|nr:hypothetical protein [Micromonosporaceae bacterium]
MSFVDRRTHDRCPTVSGELPDRTQVTVDVSEKKRDVAGGAAARNGTGTGGDVGRPRCR